MAVILEDQASARPYNRATHTEVPASIGVELYRHLCRLVLTPETLENRKILDAAQVCVDCYGDLNPRESGEVNTSILVRLAQHPVENRIFPADDFYGSKAPPPKRFACFYVIKSRPFLHCTYLSGANLYRADLSEPYLGSAYLSGANLGAYLRKISWNEGTQWENMQWLESAKNTPPALRKQLGLR